MSDEQNVTFNSLRRGKSYTFTFVGGLPAVRGVFHEIAPGGALIVAGTEAAHRSRSARTHYLNPDNIAYAREETS